MILLSQSENFSVSSTIMGQRVKLFSLAIKITQPDLPLHPVKHPVFQLHDPDTCPMLSCLYYSFHTPLLASISTGPNSIRLWAQLKCHLFLKPFLIPLVRSNFSYSTMPPFLDFKLFKGKNCLVHFCKTSVPILRYNTQ